jgi:hypothetical protein
MPRDGAIIFADLIGKLDLLWVACEKCGAVSQIFQYDVPVELPGHGDGTEVCEKILK